MPSTIKAKSTAEEVTAGLDLSDKTFVVTGVNSGLGHETMRVLTSRGAHVIGAARSMDKATAACDSVEGESTPVACELSDMDSVAACARTIQDSGKAVDGLICNAGIMALPELKVKDGLELQFLTNHMGHFLLTYLLQEEQGRLHAEAVTSAELDYLLLRRGGGRGPLDCAIRVHSDAGQIQRLDHVVIWFRKADLTALAAEFDIPLA